MGTVVILHAMSFTQTSYFLETRSLGEGVSPGLTSNIFKFRFTNSDSKHLKL